MGEHLRSLKCQFTTNVNFSMISEGKEVGLKGKRILLIAMRGSLMCRKGLENL